MINLAKVAIKRPVSMCMIVLALVVFGVTAIFSAPVELMPDIEVPMLIVATVFPGASPEDVESLVTREIEDAVSSMSGVKHVSSTSSENMSLIILEMEYGINMDLTHMDLQEHLDMRRNTLPSDAQSPIIIEINVNEMIDTITLSAVSDMDMDLAYYVEKNIVPELEKLSGVASVSLSGGQKNYISVELNERLLRQHRLTMNDVVAVVSGADFSLPIGSAERGDQNVALHGGVRYHSAQSLGNMPLPLRSGDIIRLSDVANIQEATEEKTSIGRYNGTENVTIGVQKRQTASTIAVAEDVVKVMNQINQRQEGAKLEVVNSSADQVLSSVETVIMTLIIAIILAMLVLFIFMGDIKGSLIIGTSIPLSLFATLVLMNSFQLGFNIVTLSALIIAIGNMVDNSVVVLDSCFAARDEGKDIKEAVIEGTGTVMLSQIAGTLAAIVTFLPLAFMAGMSGQMFRPLCLTIVFTSLASVLSALTIVPLMFYWLKPEEKKKNFMSRFLGRMHVLYEKLVRKTFRHKALVVVMAVLLLASSVLVAATLDFELMTASDDGTISIDVDLKPSMVLPLIDGAVQPLEEMVAAHPDVERYSLTSGSAGGMNLFAGSKSASLMVYLRSDRDMKTKDIIEQWRQETADMAGYDITISSVSQMSSMGVDSQVSIILQGIDREALAEASLVVEGIMNANPHMNNVVSSAAARNPRAEIIVDPMKAGAVGMTPIQVVGSLYTMVGGSTPATIVQDGREYDVRVEFPRGRYQTMADVAGVILTTPVGDVPLAQIATIEFTNSPQSIYRQDNQYQITVTGQPSPAIEVTAQALIRAAVEKADLPAGVTLADSAEEEAMVEEFTAIITAIVTAILLMFIVMAMQFESARFSFIVMFCIPFSMIGAFFLMRMVGVSINMVSLMGFLLLFSTVINNGILYIDTATELQRSGQDAETALVNAGISRMRPILMTSSVAIISMIPEGLGIGNGAEIMQGMALVIIGGLVTSTILTLVMLPTMYLLFGGDWQKKEEKRAKRKAKKDAKQKKQQEKQPELAEIQS